MKHIFTTSHHLAYLHHGFRDFSHLNDSAQLQAKQRAYYTEHDGAKEFYRVRFCKIPAECSPLCFLPLKQRLAFFRELSQLFS